MPVITIEELDARHARLVQAREANQKEIRTLQASLEDAQRREHGFMFVLGEIESMIAELAARAKAEQEAAADAARVAKAEQDAAALAEQLRLATELPAAVVE